MNPFHLPLSGATGIGMLLVLGAGLVAVIYVYQVFLPKIQRLFGAHPDPEERAAALLDQYKRQKAAEDKK